MNIHEFQTKEILSRYGIKSPPYAIVSSLQEVQAALTSMNLNQAVIKIQVHAGGRGRAGGVKIAKSKQEIFAFSEQLLGMKMINSQTSSEGVIASQIMISPLLNYKKEYYIGAVIDRKNAQAMLIASSEGGVDIEEVALKSPERILTVPIGLDGQVRSYHLFQLVKFLGWANQIAEKGKLLFLGLAKAFMDCDASLLEINPLVETNEGELIALDAKLSVDDNALYRQSEISSFYDPTQLSENEVLAKKQELAYVALEGNIGCMVNGAGLAMATMDIIHHYGGQPANFLDVGGGATQEKVAEGFKIILSDPKVKSILVNIFGGIMNCATLALGIVAAAADLSIKVPLIVRMEGTNVEAGKKILKDSGLNILIAASFDEAARKTVEAVKSNS
jgi:succinyl-CoA synthetase beta subunit